MKQPTSSTNMRSPDHRTRVRARSRLFHLIRDCCFKKNQISHMCIEQFKISKFIDKGKSVFSIHLTPLTYKMDGSG
jgi:hypothetical protein